MNCLTCGKPIVGRRPDAKYCSRECQKRRAAAKIIKPHLIDTPWERKFAEEWDKICSIIRNSKRKGKQDDRNLQL